MEKKRADLLDRLRAQWNTSWIKNKHPTLPVECPRCGFNALMPDLTCLVCGVSVGEKELKKHLKFAEMLREFAETSPLEEVKKAYSYGYVYLSSYGVKPPGTPRDPLDIELVLTREERELLKQILESRSSGEGSKDVDSSQR